MLSKTSTALVKFQLIESDLRNYFDTAISSAGVWAALPHNPPLTRCVSTKTYHFKQGKKPGSECPHQTHQYRAWQRYAQQSDGSDMDVLKFGDPLKCSRFPTWINHFKWSIGLHNFETTPRHGLFPTELKSFQEFQESQNFPNFSFGGLNLKFFETTKVKQSQPQWNACGRLLPPRLFKRGNVWN